MAPAKRGQWALWELEGAVEAGGEVGCVRISYGERSGGWDVGAQGNPGLQVGRGLEHVGFACRSSDHELECAVGKEAWRGKDNAGQNRKDGIGCDAVRVAGRESIGAKGEGAANCQWR